MKQGTGKEEEEQGSGRGAGDRHRTRQIQRANYMADGLGKRKDMGQRRSRIRGGIREEQRKEAEIRHIASPEKSAR